MYANWLLIERQSFLNVSNIKEIYFSNNLWLDYNCLLDEYFAWDLLLVYLSYCWEGYDKLNLYRRCFGAC